MMRKHFTLVREKYLSNENSLVLTTPSINLGSEVNNHHVVTEIRKKISLERLLVNDERDVNGTRDKLNEEDAWNHFAVDDWIDKKELRCGTEGDKRMYYSTLKLQYANNGNYTNCSTIASKYRKIAKECVGFHRRRKVSNHRHNCVPGSENVSVSVNDVSPIMLFDNPQGTFGQLVATCMHKFPSERRWEEKEQGKRMKRTARSLVVETPLSSPIDHSVPPKRAKLESEVPAPTEYDKILRTETSSASNNCLHIQEHSFDPSQSSDSNKESSLPLHAPCSTAVKKSVSDAVIICGENTLEFSSLKSSTIIANHTCNPAMALFQINTVSGSCHPSNLQSLEGKSEKTEEQISNSIENLAVQGLDSPHIDSVGHIEAVMRNMGKGRLEGNRSVEEGNICELANCTNPYPEDKPKRILPWSNICPANVSTNISKRYKSNIRQYSLKKHELSPMTISPTCSN